MICTNSKGGNGSSTWKRCLDGTFFQSGEAIFRDFALECITKSEILIQHMLKSKQVEHIDR